MAHWKRPTSSSSHGPVIQWASPHGGTSRVPANRSSWPSSNARKILSSTWRAQLHCICTPVTAGGPSPPPAQWRQRHKHKSWQTPPGRSLHSQSWPRCSLHTAQLQRHAAASCGARGTQCCPDGGGCAGQGRGRGRGRGRGVGVNKTQQWWGIGAGGRSWGVHTGSGSGTTCSTRGGGCATRESKRTYRFLFVFWTQSLSNGGAQVCLFHARKPCQFHLDADGLAPSICQLH